ncbi:MAG: imelysin family protein [Sporocytophaga sp.]|uniref:imelysin family protein n=1 Tax=Sporocytophaga sp. TaxID=2231183 RepID=UPI001B0F39D1|nr:imelysin family protein [Sporocytophaga sp.]MBO9702772.1 imelysin family protein [Sporocytophaga sp.]
MKHTIFILPLLFLFFIGCKKDTEQKPSDAFNSFDRKGMLENIGRNIIIPSYKELNNSSHNMTTACEGFVSNPTEENLIALQNAWKQTAGAWKRCELYKIGPGDDLSVALYSSIDFSPVNTSLIEDAVNTTSVIDTNYVKNKGASVKGFPAIEYLLFNYANGNAYILNKFAGTEISIQNRKNYLLALCRTLESKSIEILGLWESGYINIFIASDGKDINSSIGMLVNQLIYLTEVVKNKKLGKPLNNMGVPQINQLEARESGMSLSHIKENVISLENAFLGKSSKGDLAGFDDLLNYIGARHEDVLLSNRIKQQFDSIYIAINRVEPSLQTSLETSQSNVKDLYLKVLELVGLFKVDMTTDLDVLVTISDNDGD